MPKAVLFIIAKIKWNNRKGPPTGESGSVNSGTVIYRNTSK